MNKIIANELLPVYETDHGERVVDGRELHEFLEVGTRFNDWMVRQIQKYGLLEGEEFYSVLSKSDNGGRPSTEYILKLDAAKELCMVESNDRGKKARKYFIEIEKRFKQQQLPQLSPVEMIAAIASQAVEQERRMRDMEAQVHTLTTGLTAVPDHTAVVGRVNEYARWARIGHNEVYNTIYDILQARHGIDVRQRVENERIKLNNAHYAEKGRYYSQSTLKSKVNGIDVMVRNGWLDKFNEILVGLMASLKERELPVPR